MDNSLEQKTHTDDGMGLDQYIADYRLLSLADVGSYTEITKLIEHEDIRYLHDNITIYTGELAGTKALDTVGTIGFIMRNKHAQIANIASVPINGNGKALITDAANTSAFIIGNMGLTTKWILIADIDEAIRCYEAYNSIGIEVTILVYFQPSLMLSTAKHFSDVKQLTVITTSDQKDKLVAQLKGLNVELIVCEHTPVYDAIMFGDDYDGLMADAEIIDLKKAGYPKPQPISQTLPPVKTITSDMLPPVVWRYVDNQAKRLSTPHEYIGIPTIIALASNIGTKLSIFPKLLDDWEVVPNLWGSIIGNPSSKKSPAIDAGMKPLRNLTYKAKDEYEQLKKDYAAQKEVNEFKVKAARDELKKLAKEQASQSDDADNRISDDDLKAKAKFISESNELDESVPMLKRYIADDSTYQKLGELLSQNNKGLLVERDELTGLLASLEGEQNSEARNFYLEAYNGTGSKVMDRIGRGSIFIENHCLSIVGGIQPDKLERYLSRTVKGLGNDGLMQRFQLAVYPDPIRGRKEKDIAVDKEIRQSVYDLFETIDNMTLGDFLKYGACEPDEFCKRPHFRFTKEAAEYFIQWYDQNTAKAENSEHSIIAEHLTKYTKTVPALALIFHLIDCIEYNANLGSVSLTALQTAIKWQEMLETHMYRIYSIVTDSANNKASYLSEKILDMVKNGGDKSDKSNWVEYGFTARNLKRKNWKGLTRNDKDDVDDALDILLEHDWLICEVTDGAMGRPTERYYINPRLSELL